MSNSVNVTTTSLKPDQIEEAARLLWDTTTKREAIERITARYGDFPLADAYRIQLRGMKLRQDAGAEWIGWKMGLTSQAKREQMSLDSAIFGYLFRGGLATEHPVDLSGLIHPKAEPEIGFRLRKTLKGKVSFAEACDAIGGVCSAVEIIDSRYKGFKYFSLPDVVADNCSAGRFVWGAEQPFDAKLDLAKSQMNFYVNDELVSTAPGAEISGHPVHSLMQLAELLSEHGLEAPAGALVLAGAATPAAAILPGQRVRLTVQGLSEVSFQT